ncbi:NAD(P)-binding domain-containing protein [Pseudomonas sp. IT-P218]|uniref:NAD(P)-binding domain-containing protein n=1 Tax=Pseudomonas sp. IT-P218 TaxID=3026449 RepID=UPI0039E06282
MKIPVVGVVSIGGPLARKLVSAGHEVSEANSRGRESVSAFAEEAAATPCDLKDAFNGADAVIISIPQPAMAAIPKKRSLRCHSRFQWSTRVITTRI